MKFCIKKKLFAATLVAISSFTLLPTQSVAGPKEEFVRLMQLLANQVAKAIIASNPRLTEAGISSDQIEKMTMGFNPHDEYSYTKEGMSVELIDHILRERYSRLGFELGFDSTKFTFGQFELLITTYIDLLKDPDVVVRLIAMISRDPTLRLEGAELFNYRIEKTLDDLITVSWKLTSLPASIDLLPLITASYIGETEHSKILRKTVRVAITLAKNSNRAIRATGNKALRNIFGTPEEGMGIADEIARREKRIAALYRHGFESGWPTIEEQAVEVANMLTTKLSESHRFTWSRLAEVPAGIYADHYRVLSDMLSNLLNSKDPLDTDTRDEVIERVYDFVTNTSEDHDTFPNELSAAKIFGAAAIIRTMFNPELLQRMSDLLGQESTATGRLLLGAIAELKARALKLSIIMMSEATKLQIVDTLPSDVTETARALVSTSPRSASEKPIFSRDPVDTKPAKPDTLQPAAETPVETPADPQSATARIIEGSGKVTPPPSDTVTAQAGNGPRVRERTDDVKNKVAQENRGAKPGKPGAEGKGEDAARKGRNEGTPKGRK